MDQTSTEQSPAVTAPAYWLWGLLVVALGLIGFIYFSGLDLMVKWWERDEYSHGYMIPMVSLYLIWRAQAGVPAAMQKGGSWLGVPLVLLGLAAFLLGEMSTVYTIIQYGFLLTFYGVIISFFGIRTAVLCWGALVYLVFMIPLPNFLYFNLSQQLQLISSAIGVWVIRLFDISVYLEGNVIDLGVYKLQVVEACSGLRYLFPLMSFGFLIALLYRAPVWQRAVLFLSTIPITVLMNSFRIGVIGVTVEYWGIEMAEGFLHDFEGWVIFMGCLAVLVVEIWIFHLLGKNTGSLWSKIDLDGPERSIKLSEMPVTASLQKPFLVVFVLLVAAGVMRPAIENQQLIHPEREQFESFPLYQQSWFGREQGLEQNVLDTLKLTDYFQANYTNQQTGNLVNLYVAYYNEQTKGAAIHSPRSCIPGGGWEFEGLKQVEVPGVNHVSGAPLVVNRVIIGLGEEKQLLYYWFEGRNRNITNEYLAKWYNFWDALTRSRTDGALVRVIIPVAKNQSMEEAEKDLVKFVRDFYPLLDDYVPGEQ
ncbi:MAG: VPLPA-CTERM-specific exosortase XrtD [Rickettsiales bacterium]